MFWRGQDLIESEQKCPAKLSNWRRGGGDRVGEKRGSGITARIGDRTKRSRAGSGSEGAARRSRGGLVTCMCRSEGHREDVPAGVAGGPGVASPGGAEAGDPLCHKLESLFCWKGRCNGDQHAGLVRDGFNPCSVGREAATHPFRARIALVPQHYPRSQGAFPRTSSAHLIFSPASVIKISFGASPGAGRGLAGPPNPVSDISQCSVLNDCSSTEHIPKQPEGRSCSASPPRAGAGYGTGSRGSGK